MIKHAIYVALAGLIAAAIFTMNASAVEQIIRPYQSVRTSGMGGVLLTTGIYDQNFFGNPARVTANPVWKIQLFDIMVESTFDTLDAVQDIVGAKDDVLAQVGDKAGTNLHGRIQTTMPAVYLIPGKMGYAFAIVHSSQFDINLRRTFSVSPQAFIDVGPAFTVGRKFMKDNILSVGVTAHATFRMASQEGFSMIDLLQGKSISPAKSGGQGAHLDFDLGGTYRFPEAKPLGFDLTVAAAFNNLMGGKYSNLGLTVVKDLGKPPAQPRTYGFGVSLSKDKLFFFDQPIFAFEITDIGNNPNGSPFRLLHFGGEVKWGVLLPRIGLNQGYLGGGLGIDLKILTLDFAYYTEEIGLNAGSFPDRRFAFRLALQI